MMAWIAFGLALGLALLLIPLVRAVSIRTGRVARPRSDRWHNRPTALFGGVAIFAAFALSLVITNSFGEVFSVSGEGQIQWGLLAGSVLVFALGFYDDLKQLAPPTKLGGQILAASIVVFLGYSTGFFTPRIPNSIVAQVPNILLTFVWLIGITNAINLLDNMDGLAGGISLITAGILSFFFWRAGNPGLFIVSMALAGSILGFLVFNFPPASIFMGDSGSLFLGFTLAVLAIARQPQASNVFAVLGVPTLLFLLPILDTSLVTFTRLLRGQSPVQGGRDHTSHRLIAFGLNERQAVLVMYAVALVSGMAAATLESIQYWFSLVILPLLVISLALLTAYLGGLKVVTPAAVTGQRKPFTRIMLELTFKRRLLEVILDFFLIALTYYLAFLASSGFVLTEAGLEQYLLTLPVILVGCYLSFFAFGVYRGMWRYVSLDDLVRYFPAAVGGVVLAAAGMLLLFPEENFSAILFLLFAIFLFLGFAASRSSFRVLDRISGQQRSLSDERVLIYGAGDAGEMALRWILMNPELKLRPVGFLDDDPLKAGRQIHGVEVLGGLAELETVLERKGVHGVILASPGATNGDIGSQIRSACQERDCWVRQLRLEFEEVE